MYEFFKLCHKSNDKKEIPTMPPFDDIIEMMYDKGLSFSEDFEIINVIYAKDRSKRFVVLKSSNGYYKYTYEEICVCDEDEWIYICNLEDACPAWWEPKDRSFAYSFYGREEEAISSLRLTSEYKLYFE